MLFDTLFDRLVNRLKRSRHQRYDASLLIPGQGEVGRSKRNANQRTSGVFDGAHNFIVNDSTFNEHRYQVIQNFLTGNPEADSVLERITMYADLDATMDSSARYPPPLCHPGTRLKIGDKLFDWLLNLDRECDIQWLRGPAGTGKSAVAQTFAERCDKSGRLGASFFFSRLYDNNDPDTIVPTLVYQLAIRNPEYKYLVATQLANDPELLRRKTRRTQFTKLIVEPFSYLQTQKWKGVRDPLLVVLDGLDECEGESAQRDIIEMISEVSRLKKNFPLIWLICSRPEAHLKYIFSRADFAINCGREELVIDAESIADVDFYLRDGLAGIKAEYQDVTTPTWPFEEQIIRLSEKASGHFGFASISLRYIGDPTFATPMAQLDALLSFLDGARAGAPNPLKALDALYTRILSDVPTKTLPTAKLILGYTLYGPQAATYLNSVQKVCNFLNIDQMSFYNTFRKLHSVVNVPSPEVASTTRLRFYHLSFLDYLRDPSRAGKFTVKGQSALLQHSKLCLSWYKPDLELSHTTDGPAFNVPHEGGPCGVPLDPKWTSDDNREEISRSVAAHVAGRCWETCSKVAKWDTDLLYQIRNFDFRYIQTNRLRNDWRGFINKLWENSSDNFIRTEPRSEFDLRLLAYMESVVKSWWVSQPAVFPLRRGRGSHGGEYFLLGDGAKAVICWATGLEYPNPLFGMLNCDKAPSEKQVSDYEAWLMKKGVVKRDGATESGEELPGGVE